MNTTHKETRARRWWSVSEGTTKALYAKFPPVSISKNESGPRRHPHPNSPPSIRERKNNGFMVLDKIHCCYEEDKLRLTEKQSNFAIFSPTTLAKKFGELFHLAKAGIVSPKGWPFVTSTENYNDCWKSYCYHFAFPIVCETESNVKSVNPRGDKG